MQYLPVPRFSFVSQENELRSYFKSEYRTDWEVNYEHFMSQRIEERKAASRRKLKSFFRAITRFFIPDDKSDYEKFLSQADSHEDLERRQRMWDEQHSHKRIGAASW